LLLRQCILPPITGAAFLRHKLLRFGKACLNLDVFDGVGNRHTPREWFIAPMHIIEEATHLILNGEILKYRYDSIKEEILEKEFTVLQ
jgi:hypothetical protein